MKGIPRAMSLTARENPPPPSMRALFVLMVISVFFGASATVAGLISARTTDVASREDLVATADLVREVRALQTEAKTSREAHNGFNQADHNCIIALAVLLADPARDRTLPVEPPCRAATIPAGTTGVVEPTEPSTEPSP